MTISVQVGTLTPEVGTLPVTPDWVTVWGWWSTNPEAVEVLIRHGYEARQFGHTIQVKWSKDDPFRLDNVRMILEYWLNEEEA